MMKFNFFQEKVKLQLEKKKKKDQVHRVVICNIVFYSFLRP